MVCLFPPICTKFSDTIFLIINMKFTTTGFALLLLLSITQGCSSTVKSRENSPTEQSANNQPTNSHSQHPGNTQAKTHVNHPENSSTQTKSHHGANPELANTQAKLTTPTNIPANQPVDLAINIQDTQGKSIDKFDTFQEKLLHLIVVSDDLRFFEHIHPQYKENGKFEVQHSFPSGGNYTLFSDYKPAGKSEQVSMMKVNVTGSVPLPTELEKFGKTKTLSDTKIDLNFSPPNLKAGKEVTLTFALQDIAKKQPVKDLRPYLGEKAHLVTIKSSSPLSASDYIHAHALKNSNDGQVKFHAQFPTPGTYKMWVQFNRNGKIKTADFWVNVD
jgi:hypothetical protein